jgi:hypothetical protein
MNDIRRIAVSNQLRNVHRIFLFFWTILRPTFQLGKTCHEFAAKANPKQHQIFGSADGRQTAIATHRLPGQRVRMVLLTVGTVIIAIAILYKYNGMVSVHFYIATALGIGFAMLLTSALMGLVFLSNGTGHDATVTDLSDDKNRD